MILKNNKGLERNFEILFEIDRKKQKYVIYRDSLTGNIYGGKYEDDKLKILNDKEFEFLNNIIEKFNS